MKLQIKFGVIFILLYSSVVFVNAQKYTFFPQAFFDKNDAKTKLSLGNSTIKGVSFLREKKGSLGLRLGDKYYAKNSLVILLPTTEYFKVWYLLKLKKGKLADVIMNREAFEYRLETKTDEFGNFQFNNMKPGIYYIECMIDYVGTAVGTQQVGRNDYYNGYGYQYSEPIYQYYYYNYDGKEIAQKIVEITQDNQLVEVKLKPNALDSYFSDSESNTSNPCHKLNNLQYGTCKEFDEEGKLTVISDWKKGMQDGTAIYYYPNGNKQSEGKFKKNFRTGTWKFYYENGVLETEGNYEVKNNVEIAEGNFKSYYQNGILKASSTWVNNAREGERFLYDEKGNLITIELYKNGKLIETKKLN